MRAPGWVLLALLGCTDRPAEKTDKPDEKSGSDPSHTDSGDSDSGDTDSGDTDSGDTDSGDTDSGDTDSGDTDSGDTDSGGTDSPWFITGDCGVLDEGEWGSTAPFLFQNSIDFDAFPYSDGALSEGGSEILEAGNLGGSSLYSEIMAFELLHACEGAQLLRTETEIEYTDDGGKKTDLLVEIDGYRVGVSVTRAYHWPEGDDYTESEALSLLDKKLDDILKSAANVADPWDRSALHIVAFNSQHAEMVAATWATLDAGLTDQTLVLVTVSDGDDAFLY